MEKSRFNHIKKLLTDSSYRHEQKEFVVEGLRAVKSSQNIKEIIVSSDFKASDINNLKKTVIPAKLFDKLADTKNSQGIIAICALKTFEKSHLKQDKNYLLLDRIQDPGNIGTIIRSSCAFGIKSIIITQGCADPFSPKVVRASSGLIGNIEIIKISDFSEIKGFNIISADTQGSSLSTFKWKNGFVLAIGNEANGISKELLDISRERITINISKDAESLNAAVACAIILYDFYSKTM